MTGPGGARGVGVVVRRWVRDVVGLLLPVDCAGCGRWDVAVCEACARALAGPLRRCEEEAPSLAGADLPTWAAAAYAGPVRGVVLAWKNGPRADVGAVVAGVGRDAGEALGPALAAAAGADALGPVLAVVPAPSGWRRRARGRFVVGPLAAAVARGLADGGLAEAVAADVLRRAGGRTHQAGLGARSRGANRRRTVRVARRLPPGTACLLVDDVLTTGATLAESRRALAAAGHAVVGAFVLAATPRPGSRDP